MQDYTASHCVLVALKEMFGGTGVLIRHLLAPPLERDKAASCAGSGFTGT